MIHPRHPAAPLGSLAFLSLAAALYGQTEWENPVRSSMRNGKPVVGMTVSIPSADVALLGARLGFDFLWIEMEHSGITLETARHMILATSGTGAVPFVRVPVNELWTAKRALDIGALGVIFPFTSTPELARRAVAACKYPPQGLRGAGPGLASLRWPAPGGYGDFADRNAMVIIIIEQKQAVDNIEEILSVPGVDVAFIGPNDLSHSYGFRGKQTPEVKEAIAKVLAAGKRRSVPIGRLAAAEDIPGYVREGFQFFQAPAELSLLAAGARPYLEAAGKKPPPPRPAY